MSRDKNWGPVVKEKKGVSYKSFRSFSNKICTSNLQQNDEYTIYIYNTIYTIFIQSVNIQVDNQIALSYLLKMGGAMSQELLRVLKEIWDYLLKHQMMLSTAECLPGCLNHQVDWELRNQKDSTEWKLCPQIFQKICEKVGQPEINLFVSRLSSQLPTYYSWKPDPNSLAVDTLQQTWSHKHLHDFSPFSLIHRVLRAVELEKVHCLVP